MIVPVVCRIKTYRTDGTILRFMLRTFTNTAQGTFVSLMVYRIADETGRMLCGGVWLTTDTALTRMIDSGMINTSADTAFRFVRKAISREMIAPSALGARRMSCVGGRFAHGTSYGRYVTLAAAAQYCQQNKG